MSDERTRRRRRRSEVHGYRFPTNGRKSSNVGRRSRDDATRTRIKCVVRVHATAATATLYDERLLLLVLLF